MKVLLLTERMIKQLLSIDEVIQAVESAFKEKGLSHVQMPAKLYLFYKRYDGDLRTMPSYIETLDISAVKVVNVHPNNRTKFNLPTVMATIILVDPKAGSPLAIMGGTRITDMRTGAAGAVAAKHLARKDSKVVGLVGAGAQSKTQLMGLLSTHRNLEEVRVWSRTAETRKAFVTEMESVCSGSANLVPVAAVREAIEGVDIVVTTTPSREPLVSDKWVQEGVHFNCIGADAPSKQELDPAILKRAKIVVDDWEQASHSGEINVPLSQGILSTKDIWCEIGEIVAGLKSGRTSPSQITVFTSTGLAIQDAVTAQLAYRKALEKGLGQFIDLL